MSFPPGRVLIRRQIIRMFDIMRFDYHSSLWRGFSLAFDECGGSSNLLGRGIRAVFGLIVESLLADEASVLRGDDRGVMYVIRT